MKIFLTGATGYIGSVVAEKLIKKGHQVLGLARSQDSAKKLEALGVDVVFGDLDDLDILTEAVKKTDGVIHAGFKRSDQGFLASMQNEKNIVGALLDGIKNSWKPIIYTSGTGMFGDTGTIVLDENLPNQINLDDHGVKNDEMAQATVQRMKTERQVLNTNGIRGIVLRSPNVYGRSNGHSLITNIIGASKSITAVPYASFSKAHLWSFVHVEDLADLYVLALENSKSGEMYYTASETGLKTIDIATALSYGLGYEGKTLAVDMDDLIKLFGGPFMSTFWTWNNQSSAEKAKQLLGWKPIYTDMLTELTKSN